MFALFSLVDHVEQAHAWKSKILLGLITMSLKITFYRGASVALFSFSACAIKKPLGLQGIY